MSKIKVNEISKHDASEITINDTIKVDTISEKTSANGVTIDGVKLKDSAVVVDTISESTSAAGVTIDGVLIKDGQVDGVDVSTLSVDTNNFVLLKSVIVTSNTSAVQLSNVRDNTKYSSYRCIVQNLAMENDGAHLEGVFTTGGDSPTDIDGTYHKAYNLQGVNMSSSYEGTNQTETGEFDIMFNVRSGAGGRAANGTFDITFSDGTTGISTCIGTNVNVSSVNNGDVNGYTVWAMRYGSVDATGFKLEAGGSAGGNIASGQFFMYGLKYA